MKKTILIIVSSVLLSLSIIFYGLYIYIDGMSGGNYEKAKCTYELSEYGDDFYWRRDSFFVMFPNLYYEPEGFKPNNLDKLYFLMEEEGVGVGVGVHCRMNYEIFAFVHIRDSNDVFLNPKSFNLSDNELCNLFEKNIIPKIEIFFEEKKELFE